MSHKLYYITIGIIQTLLVSSSVLNLCYVDSTEQTLGNQFLLYSMLGLSGVFFIGDLVYMMIYYKKQHLQYIIHHILYLVIASFNVANTSFRFMRYIFGTVLISEVSGIILDIEAVYKLHLNPNADPLEFTDMNMPLAVYIKTVFFIVFLLVRYIVIPYFVAQIAMEKWTTYEYTMFIINTVSYVLMHVFWLYKIVMYIARKYMRKKGGNGKKRVAVVSRSEPLRISIPKTEGNFDAIEKIQTDDLVVSVASFSSA